MPPSARPTAFPSCWLNALKVLKQEGLFRKSGNHTQIQDMKQRIDKGEDVDLSKIQDPHTVCGLMKQYLRELPEPLCTFELYDCFIAAIGIPEETMRRQQLANVLDMLPEQNQILTKYLISFLVRVSSYASDNLMTAANLATVFAPNLIRPPGDDLGALVEYTPHSNRTMETLILHYDELLAKFPDPAPLSTPPAEIHQKSGWNHMKILPQGWKPNSTPAAQPAAATATATNTSNAPLPTGPPPPLPPHPTASYSSTPPALPPYNAAAYAPLPTGPPPPLPPAPHNSTSSSLNSQQPPQPLPRPAQLSYYGAQAASSSGPYQTRTMTVPHDGSGSGSGSEILPRRPAPQRPPPAQPSPTLPAGLPPIPAGSGLGRAQLTGSDPAAAPASPNQGRPLPTRQPEGETVGKKWLPLAGSGTQDASNTYPPAQSPLATSSLDDPSIPRRGARVMKKDEVSKVQTSSVTAMITKSMQNSSSSSSSTPSASSSSSTTSSSASASKLIKPFVPPTGVSASTRGPSPSAAAKQQQTRNPSHTVSGAAPPFASTAPPVAYSRPPASPSLGSSGSSSLASTNNNVTYAQQPAKASSMIGGQVSVSPSIQERMRNFGS